MTDFRNGYEMIDRLIVTANVPRHHTFVAISDTVSWRSVMYPSKLDKIKFRIFPPALAV